MDRARIYINPLTIRVRTARPQPKRLPVVDLSFNELPWRPSEPVQSAIDSAASSAHLYGNPSCQLLRAALAEHWSLNPDQLICGNGSEELLDVVGRVFASQADEILITEYGYIQFPIVANRVGATLVKAPETEYRASVDALLDCVTENTTVVFLANPNNPTGTMIEEAELRRLASALPAATVLVIDLAYGEFAGGDYCSSVHKLVSEFDNVIITQTFSKAYGLAGLRIGWLYAPEWMIPSLYAARGMGTANAVGQAAAIAAVADTETMQRRVKIIVSERERVARHLRALGMYTVASSANFILSALQDDMDANGARENSADAIAAHLYDDAGILVNQTREAGLEKFFRFSVSTPEHNDLLLNSIEKFVRK